jgi:putative protease
VSETKTKQSTSLDAPAPSLDAANRAPMANAPELLAPAGDWECARAAVENGADAIYFGLERFNARMRAQNFTVAALPALMEYLHRRGVRGYVTFNTLVFADEMAQAEEYLRSIICAGVDAAIVQDVGICRLIREISPDFPIHASTQMTITSAAGVEFARELGCCLVVLARECSIADITRIQEALATRDGAGTDARPAALPLEVFVHGALCVAYSGQCLTSESLGGRSANRGECAQACRMPYELVSDGATVPLGDRRYLLSPQDLAGLDVLAALAASGVASLKIEGRLKTPEYVANVTRVYRQALDRLKSQPVIPANRPARDGTNPSPTQVGVQDQYNLEMAFSRGLYTGWFRGDNNQELVHARFGKKRGVYLGEISEIRGERIGLKLEGPLKPGDGVVFDSGHPDQEEEGGRVYEIHPQGDKVWLGFEHGRLHPDRIHRGDKLWKTSDPELDRRLRQSFAGDQPRFQRPLTLEVHGAAGHPLTIIARDEMGHVASVSSQVHLIPAEKQPITSEWLQNQLGRLGGTPFRLGELRNHLEGQLILPVKELNRLRRECVALLDAERARPKRWQINEAAPVDDIPDLRVLGVAPPATAELVVMVRHQAQLEAVLKSGIRTVYCEFEDPKKYREAVRFVRTFAGCDRPAPSIWVAPPRIFKAGEEWILKLTRSCDADGYLVRNYDHLSFFEDDRQVGDFSLNVANPLSARHFMERHGLERLTASYDLNAIQLEALIRSAPPHWFEVTIHQHMPMFHMEHCVFCAFLSKGTDYTNCGRPCDHHDVKLRDRVGAEHPLKADAGCRNTVFNALAQTGAEYVASLLNLGVRWFRVEFVGETPDQVVKTLAVYRRLLRGEITGADVWRELKVRNQLGVTRGQMERAEGLERFKN